MLLLGTSCLTYKSGIVGNYESVTYSRLQQAYLLLIRHRTYPLNSSIRINDDSSYVLTNCGNIENGHWQLRQDRLMLYCDENRYTIDSFNITGFKGQFLDCGDKQPIIFKVHNGKLVRHYRQVDGRLVLYDFKKKH